MSHDWARASGRGDLTHRRDRSRSSPGDVGSLQLLALITTGPPRRSSEFAFAMLALQRAAGNDAARRAAHPAGGIRPVVLRQPGPGTAKQDPAGKTFPQWKPADAVVEIRFLGGANWEIGLSGHTSAPTAQSLIWPKWKPSTVTFKAQSVAIVDPVVIGWFTITGLEPFHLEYMEPSVAALFRDRGVVADPADNPEVAKARKAFRSHNADLGAWMHSAIHVALSKATRGNVDLMIAFYRHYSSHDLERASMKGLGSTDSGDTEISERVLMLEDNPRRTTDPMSLLGSTLIHELVHTPQGAKELGGEVTQVPKEAKAYAIELLFAERMGDTTRAAFIEKQWYGNDSVIKSMGGDKVFDRTYRIISALYEVIDSTGGAEASAARQMSTEFITKNESDFGPQLRAFIATRGL